ncbi:MAG: glycosyltransferase family 4 protein [Thermoguttaceae bacterium]
MPITILHLTASPFFGGPERQMLELAKMFRSSVNPHMQSVKFIFASFYENGNCEPFLAEAEKNGFETWTPQNDFPHIFKARNEIARFFTEKNVNVVLLHGHKARLVGYLAAQQYKKSGQKIITVGVSRGWTTENWKVAIYNKIDKWMHRKMDHVVSVSDGQAKKIIKSGTPKEKITVIRNSIRTERFNADPEIQYRKKLECFFDFPKSDNPKPGYTVQKKSEIGDYKFTPEKNSDEQRPKLKIIGAAGRLSPEKGFDVLLDALAKITTSQGVENGVKLVIFGDGFLLQPLKNQAEKLGITNSVCFAGFTDELDKFMPCFDLFVQSSHTEGLPNVLLEAMAARTAVVATDVGGTAEVVEHGQTGLLVPAANAEKLANAMNELLRNDEKRRVFGEAGRKRVEKHFTFEALAAAYWELFNSLFIKNKTTPP